MTDPSAPEPSATEPTEAEPVVSETGSVQPTVPGPDTVVADAPLVAEVAAEQQRHRLRFIVGGIAAVVLVIVAVVITLIATAGPSNTPEQAAEGYFTALANGDMKASENFVCDADKDVSATDPAAGDSNDLAAVRGQIHFEISDVVVNGKRATAKVTLTITATGGPVSTDAIPVPLVQEHGDWKVCFS